MRPTIVTREEFDARLAQSTERMREQNSALEKRVAVLEEAVAECSAILKRLEAEQNSKMGESLIAERSPRQFGAGRHLLSGAGIDVNELLTVPIEDMFADYMPDQKKD